jgi:hypothetical protein
MAESKDACFVCAKDFYTKQMLIKYEYSRLFVIRLHLSHFQFSETEFAYCPDAGYLPASVDSTFLKEWRKPVRHLYWIYQKERENWLPPAFDDSKR